MCRWKFTRYEPSAYETLWAENVQKWEVDLCAKMNEEPNPSNSRLLLRRVVELTQSEGVVRVPPLQPHEVQEADDLMSKMHYAKLCRSVSADGAVREEEERQVEAGVQLIEPLWGWLRDPFDLYCGEKGLQWSEWNGDHWQSKVHILPLTAAPYYVEEQTQGEISSVPSSRWSTDGLAPWWRERKNIMLDLGSAYFEAWGHDSSAASGRWFYQNYHQRGLKFSRFIAVEVTKLDPAIAYQQLPADLVGAYTLINTPLSVHNDSNLDVDRLLYQISVPDDVVVLKLDIDSAQLELQLSQLLVKDDKLSSIVDELMFEHHVDYDLLRPWWGKQPETLTDSYRLFTNLRKRGIRLHSWP